MNYKELLGKVDDLSDAQRFVKDSLEDLAAELNTLGSDLSQIYCDIVDLAAKEDPPEPEAKVESTIIQISLCDLEKLIKEHIDVALKEKSRNPFDFPIDGPINSKPWWVYPYTMPDYKYPIYPGAYTPPIYGVSSTCSKFNPQDLKANNEAKNDN